MVVSVNPIKHVPKITFSGTNNSAPNNVNAKQLNSETEPKIPETESKNSESESKFPVMELTDSEKFKIPPTQNDLENHKESPKGFLAKTAVAYVDFSEWGRGTIKGLLFGTLSCLLILSTSTIINVIKHGKKFNLKNASTKGKVLAFATAGLVLAGNLVLAYFRANKREAKIDDTLRGYEA